MAELRWHPLLKTWVIISSHRQDRPHLESGTCPFCPGSGRVPDDYEIYAYDNDFPSLMLDPPEPDVPGDELIPVRPAFGKCEVTLYSPRHDVTLPELPLDHVTRLVNHWEGRYRELGAIKGIDYVFIFENRGEAVGVTMLHPHGQIYAYPYIPLRVQTELGSCEEHMRREGSCLICDLLDREWADASRMVYQRGGFSAYIPSFAEYPYQVYIVSDTHLGTLSDMDAGQKEGLASALKCITGAYDSLFGVPFPYMMCLYQDPTDGGEYPYHHFHIKFFTPMRDRDKLKFNASSETGAWATINDTSPEDKAAELRKRVTEQLERPRSPGAGAE